MSMKKEVGLGMLALRVTTGSLLAAHGAQKLFGAFKGPGMKQWQDHVEKMGMTPSRVWAPVGAMSEFAGGIMTGLGLLNPLGPLAATSAMVVAARKVHWNKPIFVTDGGAELPLTNIAVALAVALEGPGVFSLDHVLGIRVPLWARLMATAATIAGLVAALRPDLLEPVMPSKSAESASEGLTISGEGEGRE